MQPKYPIYIISKGRADSRLTSKTLDEIRVPYKIVIEESEFDDYNKGISADKILTLPPGFRENPKSINQMFENAVDTNAINNLSNEQLNQVADILKKVK